MPEVDIIIRVRPSDANFLKLTAYPLAFFEKFANALNIQMQFEITANDVIAFLKTLGDFEKIFQLLKDNSAKDYFNYVPSKEFTAWEFSVVKFAQGENHILLEKISDGFQTFLGLFGQVEKRGEKVLVTMPLNLHFEKHFNTDALERKSGKWSHKLIK